MLAFYIGHNIGSEAKQTPGAYELRITGHNLERHSDEISPQLRDYLKGRFYTLLAGGIRSEWVNDKVDYGPIDSKDLGPIMVVKGPESNERLYELAMKAARVEPDINAK